MTTQAVLRTAGDSGSMTCGAQKPAHWDSYVMHYPSAVPKDMAKSSVKSLETLPTSAGRLSVDDAINGEGGERIPPTALGNAVARSSKVHSTGHHHEMSPNGQ